MGLLYYFAATVLVFVITYVLLYVRRCRHPLRRMPGPPSNQKLLLGDLENYIRNDFRFFSACQNDLQMYGGVRSFPAPLGNMGIVVSDPDAVKYVLITNGANFHSGNFVGSGFFKQAVGDNGLVVVNGEQHKRYKKILSPAYKLSTLKTSMPIVQMLGERMVNLYMDYWRKNKITSGEHIGSASIDVKHLFNKTTLDIAVLFLLGYDLQESCSWKSETFGYYLWRVLEMQENVIALTSTVDVKSSWLRTLRKLGPYLPYGGTWEMRTTNKMHEIIENIIETQVQKLQREQELDDSLKKTKTFRPLLAYMLDPNNETKLSRQEIHDLVMTFIIGGHETASITLMFSLYELCKKPEHQTRLREEVVKGFKELNDKVDWDDITKKFPFLNACCKETLRMYPPVPWLPRNAHKEDVINGYYVPANTLVMVIHTEMQRNPDIWPDPNEYKPERFLEPDDTIPWDAWLPFGDGFHKCIGYQFGLIEVTYLLAMMVKNFRFSFDPNVDYREFVFVALNTKPAIKIYVTPL